MASTTTNTQFSISANSDEDKVIAQARTLIDTHKWTLCNDGKGLERAFKFKTFNATWVCISDPLLLPLHRRERTLLTVAPKDFMTAVATQCKQTRHHPEWSNVYNRVNIRWTTHSPEGWSGKDTEMAEFCEGAAEKFGVVKG